MNGIKILGEVGTAQEGAAKACGAQSEDDIVRGKMWRMCAVHKGNAVNL